VIRETIYVLLHDAGSEPLLVKTGIGSILWLILGASSAKSSKVSEPQSPAALEVRRVQLLIGAVVAHHLRNIIFRFGDRYLDKHTVNIV
jgi:hypothetical protein